MLCRNYHTTRVKRLHRDFEVSHAPGTHRGEQGASLLLEWAPTQEKMTANCICTEMAKTFAFVLCPSGFVELKWSWKFSQPVPGFITAKRGQLRPLSLDTPTLHHTHEQMQSQTIIDTQKSSSPQLPVWLPANSKGPFGATINQEVNLL